MRWVLPGLNRYRMSKRLLFKVGTRLRLWKIIMQRRQKNLVAFTVLFTMGSSWSLAQDHKTEDTPASASSIRQLIEQLGDTSYEVRARASRRICNLGNEAYELLKEAAEKGQAEISLRAKHLLKTLDALMFSGVEVSLAVSSSSVRWHEPMDLTLTLVNRTNLPARVPFELVPPFVAKTKEGRQVGHMLDAAEYLRVSAPDGSEVNIIIDDISEHPDVAHVVEQRVEGGTVTTLAPGEEVRITLHGFNRGWARYPLYEKGGYRIIFDYTPQWTDATLLAEKVGRVVSNEVQVHIAQAAPPSVSRHQIMGTISVSEENGFVVARAHCASDKPIYVNKNFGPRLPFAQIRWEYSTHDRLMDIPASPASMEFDPYLVEKVGVGESVELARISVRQLRDWLTGQQASLDEPGATIRFTYANWCNRAWQIREQFRRTKDQAKSTVSDAVWPRRILSARHASQAISLTETKQ